ncbi:unnamed protein product [Nezara viridula]|uniref:Uncharacterized protein n=1 Tax=Nezara viridula TaxID=85310 RepID=A0A9P0EEM4_NEZVI|nr:unnamed protein product [Nezara viridula]
MASQISEECWENGEKDDIGRPGNIQQPDCEYSTPSPVSNSPDIRLSPSSPPASPSSEDNRTSLLATSKDEMKPQLPMENFYDHSPGEVYTIPEEEDEISSPTSDGVTSLRKRRLVGGNSLGLSHFINSLIQFSLPLPFSALYLLSIHMISPSHEQIKKVK